MSKEKICIVCGKPFTTEYSGQMCSKECKRKRKTMQQAEYRSEPGKVKFCEMCGEPFKRGGKYKYCSEECAKVARETRRNPNYINTHPIKKKSKTSNFDKAILSGKSYADFQKEETLKMIPKIELPEWAVSK